MTWNLKSTWMPLDFSDRYTMRSLHKDCGLQSCEGQPSPILMSALLQNYVLRRLHAQSIWSHMELYQLVSWSVVYDLWLVYTAVVTFFFRWFLSCFFCRNGKSFLSRAAVVESLSACMVWTSHPSSFIRYNIAEAISGSMALLEPTTQKLIHINYVNTDKLKVLWIYLKKIIHFLFL